MDVNKLHARGGTGHRPGVRDPRDCASQHQAVVATSDRISRCCAVMVSPWQDGSRAMRLPPSGKQEQPVIQGDVEPKERSMRAPPDCGP
jgi:hypothetical protein